MKIIFACRECPASYYIASRLKQEKLLHGIIIESGVSARKRKINRLLKKTKVWQLPVVFLDIFSLFIYYRLQIYSILNYVTREFAVHDFPHGVSKIYVEDINDTKCMEFLQKENPDIFVVRGTAILKSHIIAIPRKYVLNIHGGIVPEYRNVHSAFWAYIKRDYKNIGTSIIFLDEGIDTGDIAKQAFITTNECDSIFEVKKKNLKLAGDLILQVLGNSECVPHTNVQEKSKQNFYPTPKAADFIKLVIVSLNNKLKCLTKHST